MNDSAHHRASEVPAGQRLAALCVHLAGMVLLFVPSLIVWLRTRRNPADSWLAHQSREALNFQYTMTAAFCICAMLGWTGTPIGLRLFPYVLGFDWLLSIFAALQSLLGKNYFHPFRIRFVR